MKIKGLTVHKVLVTAAADIASEAYVGIILDRAAKKPVFMVSPAGGIDIEEVAAKTPEKILKLPIDTRYGLQPYQASELGFFLYDDVKKVRAAAKIMQQLYTAFMKSGVFARRDQSARRDTRGRGAGARREDEHRRQRARSPPRARGAARRHGRSAERGRGARGRTSRSSSSTATSGACVNGAGLAMATMDLVKYYGGEPANFLDIGGSSNPEKVVNALTHHHRRSEREGDPVQHLRRHHAHRRRGERHRDGDEDKAR